MVYENCNSTNYADSRPVFYKGNDFNRGCIDDSYKFYLYKGNGIQITSLR